MTHARNFNLLTEPWIEVLTISGQAETVSLTDLFARAHQFREIVGDLPTQSFALLRIALAVLHRAVDGPPTTEDWHDLWEEESAPMARIEAYLSAHNDRFELFHESAPFFQVADLHTAKDEFSGLAKLVADTPVGEPYFTTRIGHGLESLTPAEAARWLVHLQAFDISGIKAGAVGDPRVKGGKGYPIGTGWAGAIGGLVVEGRNLWRTLLLNLIPRDQPGLADHKSQDRPAWEAPSTAKTADDINSRPYGPLDLYTWQSRRVRLRREGSAVTGVLVTNGDKITPQNRHKVEPMTAWRRSAPQQRALKEELVYMPKTHDPAHALWRGLSQLLPLTAPRGRADAGQDAVTAGVLEWAAEAIGQRSLITVRAIGMTYGTQNAIVKDVADDRLALSTALLSQAESGLPALVIRAVERTNNGVLELRNLASNVVRAAGGGSSLADGACDRAATQAYADLNGPIKEWISTLGEESDQSRVEFDWYQQARTVLTAIGDGIVRDAGPAAWRGRKVRDLQVTSPQAWGWFTAKLAKHLPYEPQPPEETTV